jgi:hypothetical protein
MVKQKMISVDYHFRLHQTPKNIEIFSAQTNGALVRTWILFHIL